MPKGMPRTRVITHDDQGFSAWMGPHLSAGRRPDWPGTALFGDIRPISREQARVRLGDRMVDKLESKVEAQGNIFRSAREYAYVGGWGAEELRDRNYRIAELAKRKPKKPKNK